MKIALTIAGSDSGGGAGIQADLKTFQQFGVFGTSVIVALTAQNTRGVRAVETVSEAMVAAQLAALAEDLPPAALKTGMLAEASLARLVGKAIRENGWSPLVVDPVMVSTSGHRLLTPEAEDVVRESLLPLAALVTPNLDEAAILTGRAVHDEPSMERAGETLLRYGAGAALVKGGHLAGDEHRRSPGDARRAPGLPAAAHRDHLHPRHRLHALRGDHRRARAGPDLEIAVADALDYVHRAIAAAPALGGGHGPLDHTVPPPCHPERRRGSGLAPRIDPSLRSG